VRKADNLPSCCAFVTKSGNLNFLEPSGPVQACNGTDLPFNVKFYGSALVGVIIKVRVVYSYWSIFPKSVEENSEFMKT